MVLDGLFEKVLASTTAALGAEGFRVLSEIDMQHTLRAKIDKEIPRALFGHVHGLLVAGTMPMMLDMAHPFVRCGHIEKPGMALTGFGNMTPWGSPSPTSCSDESPAS